jgi:methanogenic corrinoid protein MtbC1
MQVSAVRGIVSNLVAEEPVSQAVVERARETVQALLQQGAENGLTPAEIIGAVLAPVFAKREGLRLPNL